MARTIDYWYNVIITQKQSTTELDVLDNTSKAANFNLWAYIVAFAMCVLDNLFDGHRTVVDADIAALKPHSVQWYQTLALSFQYGQDTIPGTDQYANTGLTADQVAAQKIIAQAAVTEIDGSLRAKVVKLVNGDYAELTGDELAAHTAFMNKQKDAGVKIIDQSLPPDGLKLTLDIFYDALILKSDGSRIDGRAATPVPDAISAYLKNLKFNGEYANTRLTDQLQLVDGVMLPVIKLAQAQYGGFAYTNIDEVYIPDGGYLRIPDGGLIINYRPYVQY